MMIDKKLKEQGLYLPYIINNIKLEDDFSKTLNRIRLTKRINEIKKNSI